MSSPQKSKISFDGLTEGQIRARKREWNRGPLTDLFPRIPASALDRILDACIDKNATYNLSESRRWNARRLTSIVVAHVRHGYSDYDRLLREEQLERFEARRRTEQQVWKTLKAWCPWSNSNDVLEQCFKATLVPPELRGLAWDPMDIDIDSESEDNVPDDPMMLD